MRFWISFWILLLAGHAIAIVDQAKLHHIRISASSEKTRLVFVLDYLPAHKIFSLSNPNRLVIDLSHTQLLANINLLTIKNSLITKVRSGPGPNKLRGDDLRMVFDLRTPIAPNSLNFTALPDNKPNEQRLVVDLYPVKPADYNKNLEKGASSIQDMSASTQIIASQATAPADNTVNQTDAEQTPLTHANFVAKHTPHAQTIIPAQTSSSPHANEKQRDIIIVIDPGHGGKDPGASGTQGTYEKDVVLAISRRLSELLQKQTGMRALLTRHGDYFVTLRGRLNLARKDKADMFIAIHADAFPKPDASGASVFALSASGASSEAARWLAEKENYSELGGVNLEDKSDLLRSVLLDLSQTATISLSLQLGSTLLQELNRITNLHHDSVEQARFVVLKSPDIPSVLVETGFITNDQEERRLNDPIYQQQLAVALSEGIRRYFMQNPPPNTVFAMRHEAVTQYAARAGETLAAVAKQYGLSVQALREANQLTNNTIVPGQLLHIPVKIDAG